MRFSLPACALLVLATATACAASHPIETSPPTTTGPRGSASVGDIKITDAYIPQPASPDVAAAYFTVTDVGSSGDVLLSATSQPSSQASLMQEAASGANAGTMTDITGGLSIPAHGAVELGPGGYHLMLTNPASTLLAGDTVTLSLRFRTTGTVTLKVPVTSLLSDAQTASSMPGM